MNLAAFGLRAFVDRRIFLVEPLLDCFRTLLIGALDRLLRGEPPTFEIIADGAHRQFDCAFAFDQQHHGGAGPQSEVHLQLLGSLVANQLAYFVFLSRCQAAPFAMFFAALLGLQRDSAAGFVSINRRPDRWPRQARQFDDRRHLMALLIEPPACGLREVRRATVCVRLPCPSKRDSK
jgi:hypothetical protein